METSSLMFQLSRQKFGDFLGSNFRNAVRIILILLTLDLKFSLLHRCFLEAPFQRSEVKEAIWNCGSEKAPSPDEFTFNFFKHFWPFIQDDIMRFVKHFEAFDCLSRESNLSFITHLPKTKDQLSLHDFRPISLIGSVYKIISKILTSGLIKEGYRDGD